MLHEDDRAEMFTFMESDLARHVAAQIAADFAARPFVPSAKWTKRQRARRRFRHAHKRKVR